ncbi:outer membrane protein MIP [Geomonas silvestris]|uniref:Peptidyl-prolyl cis-trans isomerase n=1 Tax=Geomonas silvestris TaxID=2740184 RepID=A0A6V8MJY2_9BACT|nr:FKBP-type peptidyl-prolyl cis-trans isomerase [Geomonas silvestris]GFO60311.1 outer membrane protein MIP [Geomonas silvestris]
MKLILATLLGITLFATQGQAESLSSQSDVLNYSIGVETARNLKKQGVDINLEMIMKGMRDGLSGEKILVPEKVLKKTMNDLQTEVRRKQQVSRKERGEDNKKRGEAFLAANKAKEGVVALPSGLQYRIIRKGDGAKPQDQDMIEVNYRGTLLDGTEFDASQEGKPAVLAMKATIPGWREALRNMPIGSKWLLFIPSQLAYGARGAGKEIGPNETLLYEVELIAINPHKNEITGNAK